MIKDRRHENNYINIDFFPKESFTEYPVSDYFTLTIITDGVWKFTLNNIDYCEEAPFVLCLNPKDTFTLISKERAAAKTFAFNPTFLNSSLTDSNLYSHSFNKIEDMHDYNLVQCFFMRNDNYNGVLLWDGPSTLQINTWLSVIGSECQSQSDGKWTCRIRRYLLQILYLIEDEYLLCYEQKKFQKAPIDYALEYIHSNYQLGLTLEGVSKHVGLNRTTLNQQCKTKTGMTLIQYLNHYRMQMAQEALCHTYLNLSEIAVCCGYNYESYFIKAFTDKNGVSPTEFRKNFSGKKTL